MTTLTPRRAFERTAEAADGRVLAAAVAGGVALDLGIRSEVVSVGGTLAACVLVAALLASRRVHTGAGRAAAANAVVFAAFLALRSSPWLVAVDLLVIGLSIAVAVLLGRDGRLGDVDLRLLAGRGLGAVRPLLTGPGYLSGPVRRLFGPDGTRPANRAHLGGVVRGLLLALPVLAVLGGLLASADAVFASFTRVDHVLPADLWAHVALLVLGTVITGGLLHVASSEPGETLPAAARRLGAVEWTVVLGGVVALFSAFTLAQVVAVSDGGRRVLATQGLTYAEYARAGYFQLLAVAALTATLLVALGAVADRSGRNHARRFGVLVGLAVALTLVVLAVALRRLGLYEQAYGWTMLRLMVKASGLWLGVAFVLLGLRLAGVAHHRRWLLPSVVGVALAIALGLNLADPEASVVRHNVARGAAGHDVDPGYLAGLSDDAVPALAEALPGFHPLEQVAVLDAICRGGSGRSGLAWNRSSARAQAARERVCP